MLKIRVKNDRTSPKDDFNSILYSGKYTKDDVETANTSALYINKMCADTTARGANEYIEYIPNATGDIIDQYRTHVLGEVDTTRYGSRTRIEYCKDPGAQDIMLDRFVKSIYSSTDKPPKAFIAKVCNDYLKINDPTLYSLPSNDIFTRSFKVGDINVNYSGGGTNEIGTVHDNWRYALVMGYFDLLINNTAAMYNHYEAFDALTVLVFNMSDLIDSFAESNTPHFDNKIPAGSGNAFYSMLTRIANYEKNDGEFKLMKSICRAIYYSGVIRTEYVGTKMYTGKFTGFKFFNAIFGISKKYYSYYVSLFIDEFKDNPSVLQPHTNNYYLTDYKPLLAILFEDVYVDAGMLKACAFDYMGTESNGIHPSVYLAYMYYNHIHHNDGYTIGDTRTGATLTPAEIKPRMLRKYDMISRIYNTTQTIPALLTNRRRKIMTIISMLDEDPATYMLISALTRPDNMRTASDPNRLYYPMNIDSIRGLIERSMDIVYKDDVLSGYIREIFVSEPNDTVEFTSPLSTNTTAQTQLGDKMKYTMITKVTNVNNASPELMNGQASFVLNKNRRPSLSDWYPVPIIWFGAVRCGINDIYTVNSITVDADIRVNTEVMRYKRMISLFLQAREGGDIDGRY